MKQFKKGQSFIVRGKSACNYEIKILHIFHDEIVYVEKNYEWDKTKRCIIRDSQNNSEKILIWKDEEEESWVYATDALQEAAECFPVGSLSFV